ncbi:MULTISPECIES: ABC transporter ATP-binding protein [Clostridiaceae]|uniref:ABC transporter ATP-binding protein n=1 Tax=Clostridiaceae TaxID=31979 RepID=UPI0005590429|nr:MULTISPECIES: ABC transporter ATP-binding protein [Clostridiaceae]
METLKVNNLTFAYSGSNENALNDINFSVESGDFITICGRSGCGKSTLLRHLKPALTPAGTVKGNILYKGKNIKSIDLRSEASSIGYVLQNPDNQVVTDKVWHELAFGLESLGYDTNTIRSRVAEMASFFGIQTWFTKSVTELSGGQKQLLNLASIMVMQPDMLLLDEPTSQLDPIATVDFLNTIKRINIELGTTIIIVEHHLDDVLPLSDRVIVMDEGKIVADTVPNKIGSIIYGENEAMFNALPIPMRLAVTLGSNGNPVTIKEGRKWLSSYLKDNNLDKNTCDVAATTTKSTPIPIPEVSNVKSLINLKEVWFRYEKKGDDIIRDLSLQVNEGEIYSIVGGNGTGKTTTLRLVAGLCQPYRGTVKYNELDVFKKRESILANSEIVLMPQNPQALFVKKTVELDLKEVLKGRGIKKAKINEKFQEIIDYFGIESLLKRHPYDLSGGEQQIVAMAKILMLSPKVLLLDEPTKALDSFFKYKLGEIIKKLRQDGVTIIIVSHDLDFCAKYSDRCSMLFNGNIVSTDIPKKFFRNNSFYTTSLNRLTRGILDDVSSYEEVISICQQMV